MRKIYYIVLTTIALSVAYWLPLDTAKTVEGGSPLSKTISTPKALPKATLASFSEIAVDEPPAPVKPPTSAYSGSGDEYLDWIIQHESGGCPFKWQGEHGGCPDYHGVPADSSGLGYGLCQATPPSKMVSSGGDWATNPSVQIDWCRNYAISRYGSTYGAYLAWQSQGWW